MAIKNGLAELRNKRKGVGSSDTLVTGEVTNVVKERPDFTDTYPISTQDDSEIRTSNFYGSPSVDSEIEEFLKSRSIENISISIDDDSDMSESETGDSYLEYAHITAQDVCAEEVDLPSLNLASPTEVDLPSKVFPTVRSIINKNSVVKSVPKIQLEVICDTFIAEIEADDLESMVNKFRLKCFEGGLDDLTKSISVCYRENINVNLESVKSEVVSDFKIENFTEFNSDSITVGAAMQVLFDRVGIGYLLD